MKKIILVLLIATTMNVSAKTFAYCLQHGEIVGGLESSSNDEAVLGGLCYVKYKDTTSSEKEEASRAHDINSPECWKGKKEAIGGAVE